MKKHFSALLSVLFISVLMMFSPVTQADDAQNLNTKQQELDQREQELNQREQKLNQHLREQEHYRQLKQRKQQLDQRESELIQQEKGLDVPEKSYGDKVSEKVLSGFSNMNFAIFEIPKSIINTTNNSNVAFGFIGGTVQGILNTAGRFIGGLTDLVTAPIVTIPIVQPEQIWDDFDAETTYGKVLRLEDLPERFKPVSNCDYYLDPPCD
jgi:putative exosortase-associated protein (TIGR04073 family)